ncbi:MULTISPECIES: chemotaxis protein CheW [Virgibacillus]|uniref:Chemotaxis protein CheW n=1 Tax=Virgibacillus pantothenticus TaxID=1473 RepID=A0A0L0QNR8_VIRPA|nr:MULTISPECIES: chemotaxis protein CheW [Virgibacillus]API93907.1 chemotaxis protein CheW [Virgibacillus sp. 6R]KNE20191.1 chemotaxis protein CheW [Virgibacillus pantothenticus]MBS7427549.1 purine-binding chemotaxis protein CheW [Virgibacillus sp. 19R1-5]MBU8565961.1 chemotaxis protein CheW [Virgibacillus pantothenticus]MBU8600938.1 chemotaxis protein CheW [Virgibacillus pantothenticus]
MENNMSGNRKVIVFQLGEEEYAVSVQQVGSIERLIPITRVPQTADFVKGVINLRGVVTPVIDLRLRFGMEETDYNDSSRIIIVFVDNMEVGLVVDAANDVIDIPESKIEPAPEVIGTVDAKYIEGVAKLEDRLLILLNMQKVLTEEEMEELKSVEG